MATGNRDSVQAKWRCMCNCCWPLRAVLFLHGLVYDGVDLAAFASTTLPVLAAMWLGKPLGLIAAWIAFERFAGVHLPHALVRRGLCLIALIMGIGFTVPVLTPHRALPGGALQEAARMGFAQSLLGRAPGAFAVAAALQTLTNRGFLAICCQSPPF